MKSFIAALQFLTVCPWIGRVQCTERQIGRSSFWFPVVGILLGLLLAFADQLTTFIFPSLVSSSLIVILMIAVSGGLHMDGLADTADGFLSSRPRERILEIMKDSHIGVMGVLAIVSVFGLKACALSTLTDATRFSTILLVPMAGRCALVLQMATLKYVRPTGLGTLFEQTKRRIDLVFAVSIFSGLAFYLKGTSGLIAVAAVFGLLSIFSLQTRTKIGGYTGDTLGASCELAETLFLLTQAASI